MIKYLFFSLLFTTMLFSSRIETLSSNSGSGQKELNNISDYNEMIKDLKQAAMLGEKDSVFYLGFVYLNGVTLEDGTIIKPDVEKAKPILLVAISKGAPQALAVSFVKGMGLNDIEMITDALKAAQESPLISNEDKDYYSMLLGSYILDSKTFDANALETSVKWLYETEKTRPTYKLQYILASLYQTMGNDKAANYYLGKSCGHPEMSNTCKQYISTGEKTESTCQKF